MRALPAWIFCLGMVASASPALAQVPMAEIGNGDGIGNADSERPADHVLEVVRTLLIDEEDHRASVTYDVLRDGILGRDSTELAVQACEAGIDARTRELQEQLVTDALAGQTALQRQVQSIVGRLSDEDWRIIRRFGHTMFSDEGFASGTRAIRERLERMARVHDLGVRLVRDEGRVEVVFENRRRSLSPRSVEGIATGLARNAVWVVSATGRHQALIRSPYSDPDLLPPSVYRRIPSDLMLRLERALFYFQSYEMRGGRYFPRFRHSGERARQLAEREARSILQSFRSAGAERLVGFCERIVEEESRFSPPMELLAERGNGLRCLEQVLAQARLARSGPPTEAALRSLAESYRSEMYRIAESEAPACAAARESLVETHLSPETVSARLDALMALPDSVEDGAVPVPPGPDALDGGVPPTAGTVE